MPGINKVIGIYHADGGIIGELKYFTGKLFGGSKCSLCDITHSTAERKKPGRHVKEDYVCQLILYI